MNPSNHPSTAGTGPRLRYAQDGRGGTIYYDSPESCFTMWYEFALSPALVIIGIPEPRFWVSQTKLPLSQRTAVLTFIGEQVLKDQVSSSGYFEYNDTIMTIYNGPKPA